MIASKQIWNSLFRNIGTISFPSRSVLIASGKQQLTKRRFYEHLRDPRPSALTARNYLYLLRVSSLVKALLESS